MARQKKVEYPLEFEDRCRSKGRYRRLRIKKLYYKQAERMILASFTLG
jgi:hypothetical protein